jgi:hypothetical protein
MRQGLLAGSALVQHLVDMFESYYQNELTNRAFNKSIMINSWKHFQINQHQRGIPSAKFSTTHAFTKDEDSSSESDVSD